MTSNVYTKNEILQNLASKGYYIDGYTLDGFLEKWKIEAIFEDNNGCEFFDKKTLDFVLNNFFTGQNNNPTPLQTQEKEQPAVEQYDLNIPQQTLAPNYNQEANTLLNNISLSDGTPLLNKVQNSSVDDYLNLDLSQDSSIDINQDFKPAPQEHKMGILEGAMLASGQEYESEVTPVPILNPASQIEDEEDFDDMSLLSESYEAQERFREYVVSELSKKNMDLTPTANEVKVDVSEETINTIARSMAKKIAKHVAQICSSDAKASAKLSDVQEKNKKMEQKIKELEEQNKKLKLLLIESNKNLNSYKPSILGFYKKVTPKNNK